MAKTPRLGPLRNSKPSMKIRSFAFALLILGVVACNAFPRGSGNSDRHLPTEGCSISRLCAVLEVNNQGFLDKNVFAVGLSSNSGSAQSPGSQRVRLGTATGNTKTNFFIPPRLVSGLTSLRFTADPIGSMRASVSQEITVAPGDTAVLTIPPL
jgi:hypothetical protein